jgi:hypothetical protein
MDIGGKAPLADAEARTGITQQQVSRWRGGLRDGTTNTCSLTRRSGTRGSRAGGLASSHSFALVASDRNGGASWRGSEEFC